MICRRLFFDVLFACRQVATEQVDHSGHIIRSAPDSLGKKRVDLGTQKQNESKIVKEDEQNKHTYCTREASEKGSHIQGKEHKIEFKQNRRDNCTAPTVAENAP